MDRQLLLGQIHLALLICGIAFAVEKESGVDVYIIDGVCNRKPLFAIHVKVANPGGSGKTNACCSIQCRNSEVQSKLKFSD
mgnify:CR=1 FL=1